VGWYAELGWRRAFEAAGLDEKSETTPPTVDSGMILELTPGDTDHPNPILIEDETKPTARYRAYSLVKAMKDAGIGRPSTYTKTVDRLEERGYVTIEEGALVPTTSGRNIWIQAAPLFTLESEREVFKPEYTAEMERLLDDVAHGREDASSVWETMLSELKSAHAAAQVASNTGALLPRTRRKLQDYLDAAPELMGEIGDLDDLTEQKGRELREKLGTRGIVLLVSKEQTNYLNRLLEETGLTLAEAVESAGLILARDEPNRVEASLLIEHLKGNRAERQVPSPKQLRWIDDLAQKAGLDESSACALVGAKSYSELGGGKGGTASKLIDLLRSMLQIT
jgi:hypothetical protein